MSGKNCTNRILSEEWMGYRERTVTSIVRVEENKSTGNQEPLRAEARADFSRFKSKTYN